MATTMTLIAKQTVGPAGASSVTFSNIPQTYTDLKVVMSTRNSRSDGTVFATVQFSFNGVTTNRSRRNLYNVSGTVSSDSGSDIISVSTSSSATASTFDNMEVYIPNYTSSNNKSMSIDSTTENNGTAVYQILSAGLWSSSSAINQITITPTSYNWTEFSTFYLYGISNSQTQNNSVPYAYGGDVITTDGSYWYHAFLYSGTFTPLKALTCDYLVVAGGGGGGKWGPGGGGGAGGYRTSIGGSALSLSANTVYQAIIGAGGSGSNSGNSSIFATINSSGGGRGGGDNSLVLSAQNGGSGGGGSGEGGGATAGTGNSGSYSPSEGNNGGTGQQTSGSRAGGGGGGANTAGSNATSNGGNGGSGTANSISGTSITYAGGGGGASQSGSAGTGGSGGGGAGVTSSVATPNAGTVNTGGGGGGGGAAGGTGGSGIIVVRYAV